MNNFSDRNDPSNLVTIENNKFIEFQKSSNACKQAV